VIIPNKRAQNTWRSNLFNKPSLYRWLRRLGRLYVGSLLLFMIGNVCFRLPEPKSFSPLVYAADSTLLCAYLTKDDKWRLETQRGAVSEDLVKALVNKEDRYFYAHPGINPFSIFRALFSNVIRGKRVSGASTLTMQLARMAEPKSRTYGNKFIEMFRAFQYEWRYPKSRILELYMSYLPYGGNIEGVHAASYLYFDRPPSALSLAQAVLLAVIPNRPNSLRIDRHHADAKVARDKWLSYFMKEEVFERDKIDAAFLEPVPQQRLSIPPQTPHFCQYIRKINPDQTRYYTPIDPAKQQTTNKLLQNHVRRQLSLGVTNGAVLVVDNETLEVIAYCGSADFGDSQALGQVDGVQAIRSPGSTLKPAAYAQAFDLGLATPATPLLDIPTNYLGFNPENYDLTFWGQTSARNALAHSRNVPVVRLANEIGLERFLDLLGQAGFEDIKNRREAFGLSVVLGGCGVSLAELTRFYSAFANEGKMGELKWERREVGSEGRGERREAGRETGGGELQTALFSRGASFIIADILSDLERPDLPKQFLEDSRLPKVAWKTGTSYGRRDAWSIGFSPRYTVGVWMGNFDGKGVPEMSGTSMAVPLLIDIFNALDYDQEVWFPQPPEVGERMVCSESGLVPGPSCQSKVKDFFLTNQSPLNACDQHEEVFVNADSSMQYCPHCLPVAGFGKAIFPRTEPELALWYAQNEVPHVQLPPHNPACEKQYSGSGPLILSPSADYEYLLEKGNEQAILLEAASGPQVSKHYWYVNGSFYKAVAPDEKVFFTPKGSKMEVSCVDDKGRKSEVKIFITYY
jgi:penicillin-binding protein 1C